jgi:hypothetical protein
LLLKGFTVVTAPTFRASSGNLSEMEEMERIQLDILTKTRLKQRKKLVTAIIQNRTDAMEAVSRVLAKAKLLYSCR